MYDRQDNLESEVNCSHDNTIDDYHEGGITCLTCNRVIDSIYLSSQVVPDCKTKSYLKKNEFEFEMHTYIREIGEKENISISCINNIIDLYNKYKEECKCKFKSEEIALFCIYISLKMDKNPILLDRLCYYFPNVKNKNNIYKLEEIYYNKLQMTSLAETASRIFSQLGISLPIKDKNKLEEIFNTVQENSRLFFNTILAILIKEYCDKKQLQISQSHICSLCYVTLNSVLKAKKNCYWIKNAINEIKTCIS